MFKKQYDIDSLSIQIYDSERDFTRLENEWNSLIAESNNPSVFSTITFVRIAWRQFADKNDKLFILGIKRKNKIISIAPFRIKTRRFWYFSVRFVKFIDWFSDKPRVITIEREQIIWKRICQFFNNEFKNWDVIDLMEQPLIFSKYTETFFSSKPYYVKITPETVSYFISTSSSWKEYFQSRKSKNRQNVKRRYTNLKRVSEDVTVDHIDDATSIPAALVRYCDLEQSGWKKGARFSIGGNDKCWKFYEAFVNDLAKDNMVSIFFLRCGREDIAGKIVFKCNDIFYSVHSAFKPKYSKYSPGILLLAEVTKLLCKNDCEELDLLGLAHKNPKQEYKRDWATGTTETVRIRIYKNMIHSFLHPIALKLKKLYLQNKSKGIFPSNIAPNISKTKARTASD